MRMFEVMAAGALLVTNALANTDLEALGFEDRRHLVLYRRPEELLPLIDHYLAHEAEREALSEAGAPGGHAVGFGAPSRSPVVGREGHEQHLQGVEIGRHVPIVPYLTPARVPGGARPSTRRTLRGQSPAVRGRWSPAAQ